MIVAFHYQFSNQAGWKCDTCRKAGLAAKRRCGWLGENQSGGRAPVWTRRGHSIRECPLSYISSTSQALVEEFNVWKLTGCADVYSLPARTVEAICLLEHEARREMENSNE